VRTQSFFAADPPCASPGRTETPLADLSMSTSSTSTTTTARASLSLSKDGISPKEASFNKRVVDSLRTFMKSTSTSRTATITSLRRALALIVAARRPPPEGLTDLSDRVAANLTGIGREALAQAKRDLVDSSVAAIVMDEADRGRVQTAMFMRDEQRCNCFNEWLKSQCIQSSNSKDAKINPETKEEYVRFIREQTTEDMHANFTVFLQQGHPDWRVPGLRTFQSMIASTPWVQLVRACDQEICCCVVHSGVGFFLADWKRILDEFHADCACIEDCTTCASGFCQRKLTMSELYALCVCPFPEGRHPKRECLERRCPGCRDKRAPMCKQLMASATEVSWREWEEVILHPRDPEKEDYSSLEVTKKSGPCSDFCRLFQEEVRGEE
jgi:hypothetical protein